MFMVQQQQQPAKDKLRIIMKLLTPLNYILFCNLSIGCQ